MNTIKSLIKILVAIAILISFVSCKNDKKPNYQYVPNMQTSVAYEAYSGSNAFKGGVEAQLPVKETIPRGHSLFEYENTYDSYLLAKENLKNPLGFKEVDLEKAKVLFDIYCSICHGVKGNGQGNLVKREKILGVPKFDDIGRAITEGSIYHTIYFGKNAMGSYKNQLSEKERWEVVTYVLHLKSKLEGLKK